MKHSLNIVKDGSYETRRVPLSAIVGFVAAVTDYDADVIEAIPAHKSLPNPRQTFSPASGEIIDDIAASGAIQVPPTVVEVEGGQYAVLDGFTRLTGLARYVAANNLAPSDMEIDVTVLVTDLGEDRWQILRLVQLALNTERVQLSAEDELERIAALRKEYSPEQILMALGRDPNQNASRGWMRKMLLVADSPALMEAVQQGDLPITHAQRLAITSDGEDDARAALAQYREQKEQAAQEIAQGAPQTRRKQNEITRTAARKTGLSKIPKPVGYDKAVAMLSQEYATAISAKMAEANGGGVAFLPSMEALSADEYENLDQTVLESSQALMQIAVVQVVFKQAQSVNDVFADPMPHLRQWAGFLPNSVRKNLGLEDREFWAQNDDPLPELKTPGRKAGGTNRVLSEEEKAEKAAKAEAAKAERAAAKEAEKAAKMAAKEAEKAAKPEAKAQADAAKSEAKAQADAAKAEAKATKAAPKPTAPGKKETSKTDEPPKPRKKREVTQAD